MMTKPTWARVCVRVCVAEHTWLVSLSSKSDMRCWMAAHSPALPPPLAAAALAVCGLSGPGVYCFAGPAESDSSPDEVIEAKDL